MLFRLVRPVKRFGSSMSYLQQRIPADVRPRAIGRKLAIPIGDQTHLFVITAHVPSVRCSLRTRDPSETKIRHVKAMAYLETVWRALRNTSPISLTPKQATALAGELYRAWAEGADQEKVTAITYRSDGSGRLKARDGRTWDYVQVTAEELESGFAAGLARLAATPEDQLETLLGPVADRLLLRKGIAALEAESRAALLLALLRALHVAGRNATCHKLSPTASERVVVHRLRHATPVPSPVTPCWAASRY
jgi:hypothetical protein